MFVLKRSMRTETAHFLHGHPGKCQFMHGHSYKWTVKVAAEELREDMVIDFGDLKTYMEKVIGKYDHALVLARRDAQALQNTMPNKRLIWFPHRPTAERMAKQVYDDLNALLPKRVEVVEVTCRETENNEATYFES